MWTFRNSSWNVWKEWHEEQTERLLNILSIRFSSSSSFSFFDFSFFFGSAGAVFWEVRGWKPMFSNLVNIPPLGVVEGAFSSTIIKVTGSSYQMHISKWKVAYWDCYDLLIVNSSMQATCVSQTFLSGVEASPGRSDVDDTDKINTKNTSHNHIAYTIGLSLSAFRVPTFGAAGSRIESLTSPSFSLSFFNRLGPLWKVLLSWGVLSSIVRIWLWWRNSIVSHIHLCFDNIMAHGFKERR